MWLSRKMMQTPGEPAAALVGQVSVGAELPAVVTDTEYRDVRIAAPGGYCWRPGAGQAVVVWQGAEPVLQALQPEETELEPGEVRIFSENAEIRLHNDGTIRIRGDIYVDGTVHYEQEDEP